MFGGAFIDLRLEVEREFDCWIDKGSDGGERHDEVRWNAAKAQSYFESDVAHLQIPELVLKDNRHFFREAFEQAARDRDAGRIGFEGDVEMVRTRQISIGIDLT